VIVSTNVAVRRDGLPYARQRTPEDPGAAVYFKLESVPEGLVLACDRWLRVEDNIAAVAAHIGALRGIDRWGVGSVRQAFAGYKRLTAGDAPTPWWEVLGIDRQAPAVAVKQAYKELAKLHHPTGRPGTWNDSRPSARRGRSTRRRGRPDAGRGPQAGDRSHAGPFGRSVRQRGSPASRARTHAIGACGHSARRCEALIVELGGEGYRQTRGGAQPVAKPNAVPSMTTMRRERSMDGI